MAKKQDSGVSLKTPQEVWDYYNVCGNFAATPVEADAEQWICELLKDFSEEEFETVIRNSAGSPAYAVFDKSFFNATLKAARLEKEVEDMKSIDRTTANSLDLLTRTVAQAMETEVKKVAMDGLQEQFKQWVETNYGPTYVAPKIYTTPKGEPIQGVLNRVFPDVLMWVSVNEPVMLTGAAGTGKNKLVQQLSQHLGIPMLVINSVQDASELQGYKTIDGSYADTPFIQFIKFIKDKKMEGIILFDEIDNGDASAYVTINDAIASRSITLANKETLSLDEIHFVACANTWGTGATDEYVGRNQLDAATLNRFTVVQVDYDTEVENSICPYKDLADFVRDFRGVVKQCGIKHVVSYRNLIQATKAYQYYETTGVELNKELKTKVLQQCLFKNLGQDDLSQIYHKLGRGSYRDIVESLAEEPF